MYRIAGKGKDSSVAGAVDSGIYFIIFIYLLAALATFLIWDKKGVNNITGDEPHYLVMASGIALNGSLEQTIPYAEEFRSRVIHRPGLAAADAIPSPANTHAVSGPNGLYNVHSIGLPVLLAIPYAIGDVKGAKIFMILLGIPVILLGWRIASMFSENPLHRACAVACITLPLPLIAASGQIYPDILAGAICLMGLYWMITTERKRSLTEEILLSLVLCYLPWLHMKFSLPCAILVVAVLHQKYYRARDPYRALMLFCIAAASCLLLFSYNHYAFGKISGPYQDGALVFDAASLMIFIGLHIDQNQGIIFNNPVMLIGFAFLGRLCRINRGLLPVLAIVYLSLVVPNALHPNYYGGTSFSGRFQWSAAMVMVLPTLYGMLYIARKNKTLFYLIFSASMVFSLYCFLMYSVYGADLYRREYVSWPQNYSIYMYPFDTWLPMLYNTDIAYNFLPNYVWFFLFSCIIAYGFFKKNLTLTGHYIAAATSLVAIVISGFVSGFEKRQAVFHAGSLPSLSGNLEDNARVAREGIDNAGFVTFGPYFPLRTGEYTITLRYRSSLPGGEFAGEIDVNDPVSGKQITVANIEGTDGETRELDVDFNPASLTPHSLEFRTYWNGSGEIGVYDIVLKEKTGT